MTLKEIQTGLSNGSNLYVIDGYSMHQVAQTVYESVTSEKIQVRLTGDIKAIYVKLDSLIFVQFNSINKIK